MEMTYICNDCLERFDEEDLIISHYSQSHAYGEGWCEEDICEYHCPRCNSEDVEEAYYDEEYEED